MTLYLSSTLYPLFSFCVKNKIDLIDFNIKRLSMYTNYPKQYHLLDFVSCQFDDIFIEGKLTLGGRHIMELEYKIERNLTLPAMGLSKNFFEGFVKNNSATFYDTVIRESSITIRLYPHKLCGFFIKRSNLGRSDFSLKYS